MMVGDGDESRPVDEWPPELTSKDVSSTRLVLLTYVDEDPSTILTHGLDGFTELEQQSSGVVSGSTVVSPLDPNMGSTACYSPVYRPSSPLIPAPVSPTGAFLNPSSPGQIRSATMQEQSMIVLGDHCQFTTTDNYVITNVRPFTQGESTTGEEGKLLLLSTNDANQAEVVVAGDEACEGQKVEVLFSNATITYMQPSDANGTRFIQIPREYMVSSQPQQSTILPESEDKGEQLTSVQIDSNDSENSNLRVFFSSLKEDGIILEPAELRLDGGIDSSTQLVDMSLLQQTSMPMLQPAPQAATLVQRHAPRTLPRPPPLYPSPLSRGLPAQAPAAPPLKRFWCEECKVLLPYVCREHQVERKICDKAVPSRARATLPVQFLSINKLSNSEEYGVFARKRIPKRTQFGPIEGVIQLPGEVMMTQEAPRLELVIETETGEMKTLDVSNEYLSNWMRFVRLATPDNPPNLLLSQLGASLFFTSSRAIPARQELFVWYSTAYAARRNLPLNPTTPVWTCATCQVQLLSSHELTAHSLEHRPVIKPKIPETLTVNILRQKNQALVASVDKDVSENNQQESAAARQYQCAVCQKLFVQRCHLRRHILLVHTKERKWFCKVCHVGFSDSFNRLRHIRKVHPSQKEKLKLKTSSQRYISYSCNHCGLVFPGMSLLNIHADVHRNINYIEEARSVPCSVDQLTQTTVETCPMCSMKFSSRQKLSVHVAVHGKPRAQTGKKTYPFCCKVCSRNFTSIVRFKIHVESHKDDDKKPHQCHICFKRLSTKSALTCHYKVHRSVWECPICKHNFSHLPALREHVKVHAVEGCYHCPHCEKVFAEYTNIRKHIRSFHSNKPFNCNECSQQFHTEYKLRFHQLRHSDIKQFMCDSCGKLFKRKDKLNEHKKKQHVNNDSSDSPSTSSPEKVVTRIATTNTSDYERYIYKCHQCMLGFKRRGMLVNHLANRHPEVSPDTIPELNLPILRTTHDYFCQYCQKIYKSSSKRKAHILKNHPGLELPLSNRQKGGLPEIPGVPNPTYSQPVGSVTTNPHNCQWCHKQYASKAKLLQHQRKKHFAQLSPAEQLKAQSQHLKNLPVEEFLDPGEETHFQNTKYTTKTIRFEDIMDPDTTPVALCTNLSLSQNTPLAPDYEVAELEEDVNGELIDNSLVNKRSSFKQTDNISTDLLSQAMSEIGVTMSDLKVLSSDQCFKLLQSQGGLDTGLYMSYPAR